MKKTEKKQTFGLFMPAQFILTAIILASAGYLIFHDFKHDMEMMTPLLIMTYIGGLSVFLSIVYIAASVLRKEYFRIFYALAFLVTGTAGIITGIAGY